MAATDSMAEVTVPSMLELDSSRSTGQVSDNIGDKPNQPVLYYFPKQKFGQTKPVFRCVQSAWFQKWP